MGNSTCAGLLDDGSWDREGRWCCAAACGVCKQERGCSGRLASGQLKGFEGRHQCCPMAMRRRRYYAVTKDKGKITPAAFLCGQGPEPVNLFCRVPWQNATGAVTATRSHDNSTSMAGIQLK